MKHDKTYFFHVSDLKKRYEDVTLGNLSYKHFQVETFNYLRSTNETLRTG